MIPLDPDLYTVRPEFGYDLRLLSYSVGKLGLPPVRVFHAGDSDRHGVGAYELSQKAARLAGALNGTGPRAERARREAGL